jgi:hypothetical protein
MKLYSTEEIRSLLEKSDKAVQRAIVALYERQTESERNTEATVEKNGVGFNGFDAKFFSSLAQQIQSGRVLSQKQIAFARKGIMKYSKQLAQIANGREQEKAA